MLDARSILNNWPSKWTEELKENSCVCGSSCIFDGLSTSTATDQCEISSKLFLFVIVGTFDEQTRWGLIRRQSKPSDNLVMKTNCGTTLVEELLAVQMRKGSYMIIDIVHGALGFY